MDPVSQIVDIAKIAYQAASKMPQVQCDVRHLYNLRRSPDYMPEEITDGATVEGIRIEAYIEILLSNAGAADTSLKDIYVECKRGRNKLGRLDCHYVKSAYVTDDGKFAGQIIEPRRTWGPQVLQIVGTLWNINELPTDMKTTLVIEVVAQRSIKKKIKLHF